MLQLHIHIHLPDGELVGEEAMAKVSDLTTAVQGLSAAIADAAAALNAPATDDPVIQPLVDQITQATQTLTTAVAAFKAAHP